MSAVRYHIPKTMTALLVYGRPPLVFGAMICAIGVMWNRNPDLYFAGVILLLIAMSFDLLDGWMAGHFPPHPTLANLADRVMDKVVYAIIFPLVAVGMMWRLIFVAPDDYGRAEMLHAISVLLLCVTVLLRDSFSHFVRSYAIQKGVEPEAREFTRLRTMVAAPVAALLYAHAFNLPDSQSCTLYSGLCWLAQMPVRVYILIEIIFFIINLGSIAVICRKYGSLCLDEVCLEDDLLRRRILAFFPNSLTVMNMMMGLLAVFFANQGRIREAFLFLLGAAIFDKLDGALARKLGLSEPAVPGGPPRITVGGIMDDIADGVSFCCVPAVIFYLTLTSFQEAAGGQLPVALVGGLYAAAGIARLVYFTLDRTPIPGYFKGMPTPAAALMVVAPLLLLGQSMPGQVELARFWAMVAFGLMIAAALVMNLYPVHYIHIGRFMDRHPWFSRFNTLLLVVFLFTPYFGYFVLVYQVLYLLSPLVTWRHEKRAAVPKQAAGQG